MTQRRPLSSLIGLLTFSVFPIFGAACGSLLGIDAPTDRDASSMIDAGMETALMCTSGQKVCSGLCVAKNDPNVGCGGSCSGCPSGPNASPSCTLKNDVFSCGVTCHEGFENCDGNLSAGCAAQLNTVKHCGTCDNDCRADGGMDFCVPAVGGPACSATCPLPNKVCGTECVDTQTNPKACGAGCVDCTVANGTGTCVAGVCNVTCNAHFCGPTCAPSTDSACWSSTGCVSCAPGQCDQSGVAGGCFQSGCLGTNTSCGPMAPCVDCTPGICMGGTCHMTPPDSGIGDGGCMLGTQMNCAFCGDSCGGSLPCCSSATSRACGSLPPDSGPVTCL